MGTWAVGVVTGVVEGWIRLGAGVDHGLAEKGWCIGGRDGG